MMPNGEPVGIRSYPIFEATVSHTTGGRYFVRISAWGGKTGGIIEAHDVTPDALLALAKQITDGVSAPRKPTRKPKR